MGILIPFAEWLPDFADHDNPGSIEAKNVLPAPDGYRPLKSLSVTSDALDSACLGGIAVVANDGSIYNYCGSTNSLYELRSGSWVGRLNFDFRATPGTLILAGATADVVFS